MKKLALLLFTLLFVCTLSSNATVLTSNSTSTIAPTEQKQTWLEKKISRFLLKKWAKTDDPCDLIYLQDGNEISAKVSEITDTDVKYKKCNNLTGPNITIAKAKILENQVR